ncbi:MAG: 16S rRNA (guanine(527)-N(7))-methyltransferase RsmG, partial [Desulfosarcinaceae bacterium]
QMLIRAADELDVAVSEQQAGVFGSYAEELLLWNRKMNLTAITEPQQTAVKHFVDSLAGLSVIGRETKLVDIGTGAGFPGLPLKIVRPDLEMTLVDSVRKKISFVNHVIRRLALSGVRAVHARVEALAGEKAYAGAFEAVVCRAMTDMGQIIRLAMPLLACPGRIIAYKGPKESLDDQTIASAVNREQKETGIERAVRISRHTYRLPVYAESRTLVVVDL